jgi:hypothetical protein
MARGLTADTRDAVHGISGSHGDECEDVSVLGYCAV